MFRLRKPKLLNVILFYIFVLSAFVDMYNGYTQLLIKGSTILPNAFKGFGILLMIVYLFQMHRVNKAVYVLLLLLLFLSFSCTYWILSNYLNIKSELPHMVKMFYPYIILFFILCNKTEIRAETLINYLAGYALVYFISFMVNVFTGFGVSFYSQKAVSVTGLLVSGNDFALAMLITNCLVCYMFLVTSKIRYALMNLLISLMTVMIGSVAGIFGTIAIMGCFICNGFFIKNYRKLTFKWQRIYQVLLLLASIPLLVIVTKYIIQFSDFTREKYSFSRLLSGGARNWLREAADKMLEGFKITDFIFGVSVTNMYHRMGDILGWADVKPIELDHYTMISCYGAILGGMLLLLPAYFTFRLLRGYFKYRSLFYFWLSLAMIFFVVHGFMAGHAFSSILVLQFVSVLYFCYYKHREAGYFSLKRKALPLQND